MAEELIDLMPDAPQSDSKRQSFLNAFSLERVRYLGKVSTEEKINELGDEEIDKPFNNYKAKLLGQMIMSLGKSIINMYVFNGSFRDKRSGCNE